MVSKNLLIAGLFLAASGGAQLAAAQSVNFSCPKAGTTVVRGVRTYQLTRSTDKDPYVCNGFEQFGKRHRLLFNMFSVSDDESAPSIVRDAFIALLSGNKQTVSLDFTNPLTRRGYHLTWTYLRRDVLTIGGKPFDTLVFEEKYKQINGANDAAGTEVRWLDPKDGLWLKKEAHLVRGYAVASAQSYEDTSITLPQ